MFFCPAPFVNGGGFGGSVASESAYLADISRGNRTGIITVTTTATLGGGTINNLLDGGFGANGTDGLWVTSGQSGREVKFDFGTSEIIDGVRCMWGNVSQGTWSIEGSHDDSGWTQLMAPTANFGSNTDFGQYDFTNTTAYRYYRLLQTAGVTTSTPWILETEFRVAIEGLDPVFKSGDRSSLITVTSNVTWAAGSAAHLVNGTLFPFAAFTAGESLRQITFDFATGKVITGFLWLQYAATTHGDWLVEGSDDDTAYTEVSATAAFGGHPHARTWANTTAYRYYRLRQTSGTTSGSPALYEIEFVS